MLVITHAIITALSNILLLVCVQCENCCIIDIEGVDTEYIIDFHQVPINEILCFKGLHFVVASNTRDNTVNLYTECLHFRVVDDKNKAKVYKKLAIIIFRHAYK